jgi:hypothetical protein
VLVPPIGLGYKPDLKSMHRTSKNNKRMSGIVMSTINESSEFVCFRLFYLAKIILMLCALN